MSVPKVCYGWQDGDAWFLSLKPREANAAKNKYASKEEATKAATLLSLTVKWD